MSQISDLSSFLGLQRSTIGMLLMVILVGMGERMAERFLPIYLIALGGGPIVIGLLNGLDNLMSALYAFPGGYLSDRLGFKKALFVVAQLLAVLAAVMQQKMIEENPAGESGSKPSRKPEKNPLRLFREMSPALKRLLVSDILVRFCEQIPYAFVVVWCMKIIQTPITAFQFGILTGIEMATAMLIYIPVA